MRTLFSALLSIYLLAGCGGKKGNGKSTAESEAPVAPPVIVPTVVLSAPTTVTADDCSAVTVNLEDGNSNLLPVSGTTSIKLIGAGASGAFYSAPNCTAAISSIAVPEGDTSATVYYRKTSAGAVTLRASTAGFKPASLVVTISVGATQKLVFTTGATAITAGLPNRACINYRVTAQDVVNGVTPIKGTPLVVNFSDGGAGGAFYSNSTCTNTTIPSMAVDASTLDVYYNIPSSSPGNTITISASSSLPVSVTTRSVTISSGQGQKLTMTGATVGTVSSCLKYTILAVDESNARQTSSSPVIPVQLSNTSDGNFYSNSACTTGPITSVNIAANGNTATVYFKKTTTGTASLSAIDGSANLTAASVNTNISSGIAESIVFSAGAPSQSYGACGNFTIQARDENNQASMISGTPEIIDLIDGSDGVFYQGSGCLGSPITSTQIAVGANSVLISYSKPTVGSVTLNASGSGMFTASRNFALSVGAPASKLAFIGSATPLVETCTQYRVQAQNSGSVATNVTAIKSVVLDSDMSEGAFFSDASCNVQISAININANANTATFYVYSTTSELATFTATTSGLTAASLDVSF
ncbi:MAG: hypothetical protein KF789_05645 [Bdellovibrionaceae bacterium]|nr:hypothetical protein [Pseudobdellovibrionaceae bacterium]